MKALLVDIDLRVRIVIPDDATDEDVLNAAVARAKEVYAHEGDSFFYENIGMVQADTVIPYDPENDPARTYYQAMKNSFGEPTILDH